MSAGARIVAIAAWAAIVLIAGWIAATGLVVANPRGLWTVNPDPPAHQLWEFAQEQFGDREILLVVLRMPENGAAGIEDHAAALQRWIGAQPEVQHTLGMEQAGELAHRMGPFGGRTLSRLRSALLGRDGVSAMTYVVLVPPTRPGGLEEKVAFLTRLSEATPTLLPKGATLALAGQPAVDVALDRLLREDFGRTVPVAMLATALPLVLLLGWWSVAALATVVAALVVLLAGLALTGVPVSSATAVALPLTVVVGISYSAHVALAMSRRREWRAALADIAAPLAWSYLTTLVALGSFAFSPIRALRLFAAASCAGLTVAFVAAVTLTPFVWPVQLSREPRKIPRALTRFGVRVFRLAARASRPAVTAWLAALAVMIVGLLRVQLEPNNYLSFFPEGHAIARAYRAVDSAFGGSLQLQVLAEADSGVAYRQERVRARLAAFLDTAAAALPIASALPPPPGRLLGSGDDESTILRWFVGRDARYTRAMFAMPILPTDEARRTIGTLDAIAAAQSDAAVRLRVTGLLPASMPMQRLLLSLMVRSLLLLSVVVVVALAVVTRSVGEAFVLLIPNLLAVVAVLAVMGWAGTPIDFTTISVVSLVLGVAVDDTLQIAWAGRGVRGGRYHPGRAMRRTSAPVLLGAFAMIAGAATLTVSPFGPTARLGALLAVGLLVGLAADLTLTPLLLAGWSVRRLGRKA
jgi:predicted RND superfamily exporter protein